ncbi:MAG: hypothetical protein H0Z32_08225 [Bacillaceae bacterium]|nr:hypothetical protein [Bacillaceae bacterium]
MSKNHLTDTSGEKQANQLIHNILQCREEILYAKEGLNDLKKQLNFLKGKNEDQQIHHCFNQQLNETKTLLKNLKFQLAENEQTIADLKKSEQNLRSNYDQYQKTIRYFRFIEKSLLETIRKQGQLIENLKQSANIPPKAQNEFFSEKRRWNSLLWNIWNSDNKADGHPSSKTNKQLKHEGNQFKESQSETTHSPQRQMEDDTIRKLDKMERTIEVMQRNLTYCLNKLHQLEEKAARNPSSQQLPNQTTPSIIRQKSSSDCNCGSRPEQPEHSSSNDKPIIFNPFRYTR